MKTYAEAYCKKCREKTVVLAFGSFGGVYCATPQSPALLRWLEKHAGCPPLTLCVGDEQRVSVYDEIGYPVPDAGLLW